MTHVRLGDVAEINPRPPKGTPTPPNMAVSFLPMACVAENAQGLVREEARVWSDVSRGFTYFGRGDVLVAKITPCFENGKIAIAAIGNAHGFGSTEFHVIRPKECMTDARYIFHFLRQPWVVAAGARRMTGSAGQQRVPSAFLSRLQITWPPPSERQRMVAVLDHADSIRAQRHEAITKLGSLPESVFLDIFGDPSNNPKQWPVARIRDLVADVTYGTSKKASETAGAFKILRMNNISCEGTMDLRDLKYIDLEPSEVPKHTVRRGDLLFNRTNSPELVGKTAVYKGDEPMAYAGYLVRARPNRENTSEYIAGFLNSRYGKAVLRGMCKAIIGMANINATEMQTIKIPKPPPELQRRYSAAIAAIDDTRSAMGNSLAKLYELFESLQSRMFGGALSPADHVATRQPDDLEFLFSEARIPVAR